jgi:hypothetical protein
VLALGYRVWPVPGRREGRERDAEELKSDRPLRGSPRADEILRCAQDDGFCAQDDGFCDQDDRSAQQLKGLKFPGVSLRSTTG